MPEQHGGKLAGVASRERREGAGENHEIREIRERNRAGNKRSDGVMGSAGLERTKKDLGVPW
jgi:hypothetical protein